MSLGKVHHKSFGMTIEKALNRYPNFPEIEITKTQHCIDSAYLCNMKRNSHVVTSPLLVPKDVYEAIQLQRFSGSTLIDEMKRLGYLK